MGVIILGRKGLMVASFPTNLPTATQACQQRRGILLSFFLLLLGAVMITVVVG